MGELRRVLARALDEDAAATTLEYGVMVFVLLVAIVTSVVVLTRM